MIFDRLKAGFVKLKNALAKTRSVLGEKISALFSAPLSEETLSQLEKLFYEADLGVETAKHLAHTAKEKFRKNPSLTGPELLTSIKEDLLTQMTLKPKALEETSPKIFLIVGVNGSGKTTSIAKLGHKFQLEGKKVLVAAADTFRAAAVDQLERWAHKLSLDIVKGKPNGDPAAVVFDALQAAKARGSDIVLIDTAGRLHNKTDLMQELEKIKRICKKFSPAAPQETLLVIDATIGQNGVEQAKTFHSFTPLTGLILTKLDGSAKGGIVVAIQKKVGVPVTYVGLGEGAEDLQPFSPVDFVNALFE